MKLTLRVALTLFALSLVVPLLGAISPSPTVPAAAAAVRQGGNTALLPQIIQNGARVAAADRALVPGRVRFWPARKGRPVVIQRRVGVRPWRKVTTLRQNGAGVVDFVGPGKTTTGRPFTYRGVAVRWGSLPRVAARPRSVAAWKTRFSDEFKGTVLRDFWSYRQLGQYNPGRACSASSADAVTVRDGRLLLWVKRDGTRVGPCVAYDPNGVPYNNRSWYKNGHISTSSYEYGKFTYGVAAARVKFDRPRGAHGAFWLQTTVPYVAGRGPAGNGAEVDVVEYFGKDFLQGDVYQFIHYTDASGVAHKVPDGTTPVKAARRALGVGDDWFKRYHVFSVEWTASAYVFRVDGIQTLKVTRGVSRVPEFLILSMLSSDWELDKMDASTLPNATQVDWVRFWQK